VKSGRAAALIFALVWLSCAWFGSWPWNPNTAVRLFASLSLVEHRDATITEFGDLTIDKARFGTEVYSDKAPGMSLMALPAVAGMLKATGVRSQDVPIMWGHWRMEEYLVPRVWLAAVTGPALLTAIAAVLLFLLGRGLTGSGAAGAVAAIGYGLGTPAWGWSTTLFGHAAVAALLVIAVWAVWRGTQTGIASLRHAALAGAALGWAVVVEHPAALFGAIIGMWALWRLRGSKRALAATGVAMIAVVIALLPLLAYNLLAFGTPFRLGYEGVVGFDGMKQGLFGLTYPKLDVLYEITIGTRRGLIWVAPLALPGLAGLALMVRARETRDIGALAVALVLTALLYNASYAYWDGGNSTGPRHAVPALPFLALGLAGLWRWRVARWPMMVIVALSIAVNAAIAAAEIASGGQGSFPLWTDVIGTRFLNGELRTLPSMFGGFTPWAGFQLWGALAVTLLALLVITLRTPPLPLRKTVA
jgi:hypothetical protein